MSDDMHTLSEDERAELERLRQEKKLREAQAQAAAERAELERLRAEQAQAKSIEQERKEAEHIAEVRARGAKLMQPDEDDLRMPIGQKIVIISVVLLAILFFITTFVLH